MAVRVKKLARTLSRPPGEVLGLLHAIGYTRYGSAEDMLPGTVIRRVEQAIREGVRPLALAASPPETARTAPSARPSDGDEDLMATLVPGVVPLSERDGPQGVAAQTTFVESLLGEEDVLSENEPVSMPAWSLDEPSDLGLDGHGSDRIELEQLRTEVARLSAALHAAEVRLAEVRHPPSVRDLLHGRGLRGFDELERALAGLAERKLLFDALAGATLADRGQLQALLATRVILAEETPLAGLPEALVPVVVSPERAEVPRGSVIDSQVAKVSEEMMLCGRKALGVLGADPLIVHLLATRLDPRIALVRGGYHGLDPATSVVVLWGDAPSEQYDDMVSRGAIAVRGQGGWRAFIDAVLRGLVG